MAIRVISGTIAIYILLSGLTACSPGEDTPEETARDYRSEAFSIAQETIIIDTHIDTPYRLEQQYEDVSIAAPGGDFDYPRAMLGGLDVAFMSIFIPASYQETGGAKELAERLIDSMLALQTSDPDKFQVVSSIADVHESFASGRLALALGMENGAAIEDDIANLQYFYDRGIRYITLAHSRSNLISDSSYDENRPHGGLSAFGEEVVAEMNRLGIMVDISHVSDETFYDVIALSKVPVIASHSSPRHFIPDWERNMDDDMIRLLAANGGVIQINVGSSFLTAEANVYSAAEMQAMQEWFKARGLEPNKEGRQQFVQEYRKDKPYPYATLDQALDVFDYTVNLAGIDHVGIGSDFDGVGDSLPQGLKDVSAYPNLIEGLLRRGYSRADIEKILSGNLLRVWSQVESYADSLREAM